jgi:hypothetical protein
VSQIGISGLLFALCMVFAAPALAQDAAGSDEPQVDASTASEATPRATQGSLRRSGTMELDPRLITGTPPGSGAVYLFRRAPRRLPGLVKLRTSYRSRITGPILGPAASPNAAPPPARTEPRSGEEPPTSRCTCTCIKNCQ